MAINAGDLVMNVRVNATQFRQSMGQTVAAVSNASKVMDSFAKKTEKIGGTGFGGFFDPSGQAKGFIDTASAMKIYETEVNNLAAELSGFSATLGRINAPLFTLRRSTAELVPVTRAATAATRSVADSLGISESSFLSVSSGTALAASGFSNLISRTNVLQSVLRNLNIVNFNVFSGFLQWNTLDVLAGPGRLVEAFDRLKVAIFGGAAPIRALQFATALLLPGLQAAGQALQRIAKDDATRQFGANILKLANDLQVLGSSWTPAPIRIFVNALRSAFQTIQGLPKAIANSRIGRFFQTEFTIAQAAFEQIQNPVQRFGFLLQRVGINARQFAISVLRIAAIAPVAIAVTTANVAIVQLTRVLGLATRAAFSFAQSMLRVIAAPIASAMSAASGAVRSLAQNLGLAKSQADQLAGAGSKAANSMKSLGQQSKAAQGFIFGLSGLGPGITLLAQGGLRMAGAFGLVSGAIGSITSAANFEQIINGFETLTGSAEKARATVKDLIAFSDITPFEPGPIVEAGKALVTAGVATEDLRKKLKSIGDIAAGTGQPVEELAQIYARVRNENRLTGEVLSRLGDRGIPVAKELAKAYGTTEAGVRDLAEKGRIGIEALDFAFANLSAEGGKFGNLMAKQSTTVGGLFSTLTGRIKSASIEIGLAFFDAFNIRGALSGLISAATLFQSSFIPIVKSALGGLGAVFTSIISPITAFVTNNFGLIQQVAATAFSAISQMASSVGQVFSSIAASISTFVAGSETIQTFGIAIGIAIPIVAVAIPLVSLLGGAVGFLGAAFAAIVSPIGIAVLAVGGLIAYLGISSGMFTDWSSFIQDALLVVQFGFENWQKVLKLALLGTALGVIRLGNQLVYVFGTVIPAYLSFMYNNWSDVWKDIVNYTSTVLSNLYTNIVNFFAEVADFLASGGTKTFQFDWTPLTEGFTSAIKALPVIAEREIGGLEAALAGQVGELQNQLGSDLQKYIADRKQELEKVKDSAKDAVVPPEQPAAGDVAGGAAPGLLPGKEKAGGRGGPDALTAAEAGSSEAFKAIAEARRAAKEKDGPAEKQLFISTQMLKEMRQLNANSKPEKKRRGKAII